MRLTGAYNSLSCAGQCRRLPEARPRGNQRLPAAFHGSSIPVRPKSPGGDRPSGGLHVDRGRVRALHQRQAAVHDSGPHPSGLLHHGLYPDQRSARRVRGLDAPLHRRRDMVLQRGIIDQDQTRSEVSWDCQAGGHEPLRNRNLEGADQNLSPQRCRHAKGSQTKCQSFVQTPPHQNDLIQNKTQQRPCTTQITSIQLRNLHQATIFARPRQKNCRMPPMTKALPDGRALHSGTKGSDQF